MIDKFLNNIIIKNFSFLLSSQIIAQLISLVGVFFIPKLLGPEKYGSYQIILSYVLLYRLTTYTGLSKFNIRYLSKSKGEINEIISQTLVFRLISSVFGIAIGIFILQFIDYGSLIKTGIVLFFIYLILFSISDTIKSIFISYIDFNKISQFLVIKMILQVSTSIFFLKLGYGIISLIVLYLLAELVILILFATEVKKKYNFKFNLQKFSIFNKIKNGYKFSIIEFLNLLSSKIDIFMLSILVDPSNLGVYAFANTITRKGLIVRRALQQPLFPYYSTKKIKTNTFKTLNKHLLYISLFSSIFCLIVNLYSTQIVTILVGAEFSSSAEILKILVFYLFFHYAVMPFATFLESQNFESLSLKIGFFRAITNILLNLIFYNLYGMIGIAYSSVVVWALNFIIYYIYSLIIIKENAHK